MKLRSLTVAAIVFGSSLVLAQVCPPTTGSVCLVPSQARYQATTYTLPATTTTTVSTVPYSGTMGTMPMYSATGTCPTMGYSTSATMPMYTATGTCPTMGYSASASMPMYSYNYPMTGTATMPAYSTSAMMPMYSASSTYPTMGSTSYSVSALPSTGAVCLPSSSQMPQASYYSFAQPSVSNISVMPISAVAGTSQSFMCQPIAGQQAACPNVSPETACIVNQIMGLRSDIHSLQGNYMASVLEMRGQDLITRMNRLMAGEMLFRQQLAANPNLPNAQAIAMALSTEADALNRDIASFDQQLAMVPADQRPFVGPSLSSFAVAVWDPAMQQFNTYRVTFASAAPSAYQPAFAANPWLQTWQNGYMASLNNIAMLPQSYASAAWWNTPSFASGMACPTGIVFVPAGTISSFPAISTLPVTMAPMTPVAPPTTAATTTTTTVVAGTEETTTTPPAATEMPMPMPMPETPTTQPGIGY